MTEKVSLKILEIMKRQYTAGRTVYWQRGNQTDRGEAAYGRIQSGNYRTNGQPD